MPVASKIEEFLRNARLADDGTVHGFEDDYATFSKRGQRGDQDLWGQHLQNLIRNPLGDSALALVMCQFHTINCDQLARISIDPANQPVQERKDDQQIYWHRTPTSTIAVTDPQEKNRIVTRRWGRTKRAIRDWAQSHAAPDPQRASSGRCPSGPILRVSSFAYVRLT